MVQRILTATLSQNKPVLVESVFNDGIFNYGRSRYLLPLP